MRPSLSVPRLKPNTSGWRVSKIPLRRRGLTPVISRRKTPASSSTTSFSTSRHRNTASSALKAETSFSAFTKTETTTGPTPSRTIAEIGRRTTNAQIPCVTFSTSTTTATSALTADRYGKPRSLAALRRRQPTPWRWVVREAAPRQWRMRPHTASIPAECGTATNSSATLSPAPTGA